MNGRMLGLRLQFVNTTGNEDVFRNEESANSFSSFLGALELENYIVVLR